ncbi:MAG: hypoxanthine-guanine phosphoribosyltransferase [Oceanospirillaceae bacterium]|nr:hypoxanthine-guanine phosphoribosyltransferase [Oceanospirillaceae bacterium]MCP5334873.1 hypoxanthine-guanine phosphoribosyltransferase [Oceanospirillaceae bacterium]MCP5349544.1 hypoxanthine-guanine phosphoribosyltransferase [Oceanospirillaceae bacterium]
MEYMHQVMSEADCLFSSSDLQRAIAEMADAMGQRLKDQNPVMLSVMNGGLIFAGQLFPKLNFLLETDYIHATRYRGQTSGGEIHWKAEPATPLVGRVVVIVDDILDQGSTLVALRDYCLQQGAIEVQIAVLVEKLHDRKFDPNLKADYVGVQVPDRYVFGYGMDYKGYWRNAAGIFAVKGM